MLLKHQHDVLILVLPCLNPSLRRSTGYLISTNLGDLVTDKRAARLEAETLRKRKEDNGVDTLLRSTYGDLLKLSQRTEMTVRTIPIWPALARAPKYRNLTELQDQLDWTADVLGVKLPKVETPYFLNMDVTLGMRICDPEELTWGV